MGPYDPERFVPSGVHGMGDDTEWDLIGELEEDEADALADAWWEAQQDAAADRADHARSRPIHDVRPRGDYL